MKHLKMLLICLVTALIIGACGSQPVPTAQPATPPAQPTTPPATVGAAPQGAALEASNKALVLRLYDELYAQGKTDVLKQLFAASAVHHGAAVPAGPAGQLALFESLKAKIPGMVATVKRAGADGDLVAVHWHASATPANEASGQSVVDLFRLEGGAIVEHWDVAQDAPATTASGNSLFSDLYTYAQPPTINEEQEEANRQMVVMAYKGVFNDRKLELLDQYWDPIYLQHNPMVPNGTEGLKGLLQNMPPGGMNMEFFQTVGDHDLVWTFSQMPGPGGSSSLLTDIFRVVDGKIVEHWDIMPPMGPPPGQ